MANPHPHSLINLEEITARNQAARYMIAGFTAEMPALAEFWRHLDTALTDNLTLTAEVTRLNAELAAARLDRANLLAAMRATLAAHADGEPDPLYYLRDAVRVYPTRDDLANRCELGVLNCDPHADAIPWPRAVVTAHLDGEPGPLSCLRDELAARGQLPADPGGCP